jgi:hypothetical protein
LKIDFPHFSVCHEWLVGWFTTIAMFTRQSEGKLMKKRFLLFISFCSDFRGEQRQERKNKQTCRDIQKKTKIYIFTARKLKFLGDIEAKGESGEGKWIATTFPAFVLRAPSISSH